MGLIDKFRERIIEKSLNKISSKVAKKASRFKGRDVCKIGPINKMLIGKDTLCSNFVTLKPQDRVSNTRTTSNYKATTNQTNNLIQLKKQINNASSATVLEEMKTKLKQGKFGKYSYEQMGRLLEAIIDKKVALQSSRSDTYDYRSLSRMDYQQMRKAIPLLSKKVRAQLNVDLGNNVYKQRLSKQETQNLRGYINQLYYGK